MRANGILLSISSLPSKYGIGCFSKEAYDFIDKLKEAGQHYWQILPLGPVSYGDSPYQSFSTFAGNPYYIDLETLIDYGWLKKEDVDAEDIPDVASWVVPHSVGPRFPGPLLIRTRCPDTSPNSSL